jgi:hypothetical protein
VKAGWIEELPRAFEDARYPGAWSTAPGRPPRRGRPGRCGRSSEHAIALFDCDKSDVSRACLTLSTRHDGVLQGRPGAPAPEPLRPSGGRDSFARACQSWQTRRPLVHRSRLKSRDSIRRCPGARIETSVENTVQSHHGPVSACQAVKPGVWAWGGRGDGTGPVQTARRALSEESA